MPNKMERFTMRARRVLALAQTEAERMQHSYIGTEHMLVGLMREEGGVGARVLHDLGLDSVRVADLVEQTTRAGARVENVRLDLMADTKKVLELAVDEARRMGHHYIGTEHLLLGLARQSGTPAMEVLKRLNVAPEEIRRQVRRVLQESPTSMPESTHLTPRGWMPWLTMAGAEAKRLQHDHVGTEHLLIALLSNKECGDMFRSFGLDRDRVVDTLKEIPGERASDPDSGFSSELLKSLGLVMTEIFRSEKSNLPTSYLLLGMVRNKESVAVKIMEKLGIAADDVEKAARNLPTEN